MGNGSVYWIGTDGNAWLKASDGKGGWTTQSYGQPVSASERGFSTGTYSAEAQRIKDPNPVQFDTAPAAAAPVDPYAKWGGQSAYNSLVSGFNKQKENIGTSAREAASTYASSLPLSIQDMVYNLTRNQEAINRKNVQNESSKIQGSRDIMSMVGQGIKSGGVTLANKNAGASSAAQAIANAYSQLGGKQMGKVNQQYATNAENIAVEQADQDYQRAQAPVKFGQQITDTINRIVNDARDKFAQLDASMSFSSLPDRINIEAEKEAIRQDALSKLQAFDAQFAGQVGNIRAADRATNIGRANELLATGQADPSLFNYTTEAPQQFQGTGPFSSELPLFTYRRRA